MSETGSLPGRSRSGKQLILAGSAIVAVLVLGVGATVFWMITQANRAADEYNHAVVAYLRGNVYRTAADLAVLSQEEFDANRNESSEASSKNLELKRQGDAEGTDEAFFRVRSQVTLVKRFRPMHQDELGAVINAKPTLADAWLGEMVSQSYRDAQTTQAELDEAIGVMLKALDTSSSNDEKYNAYYEIIYGLEEGQRQLARAFADRYADEDSLKMAQFARDVGPQVDALSAAVSKGAFEYMTERYANTAPRELETVREKTMSYIGAGEQLFALRNAVVNDKSRSGGAYTEEEFTQIVTLEASMIQDAAAAEHADATANLVTRMDSAESILPALNELTSQDNPSEIDVAAAQAAIDAQLAEGREVYTLVGERVAVFVKTHPDLPWDAR